MNTRGMMRQLALTTATLLALMLPALVRAQPADLRRNGWRTDYRTALAEARRTGKPLMVVIRCFP